jgi:hypothetical protein
MVQDFVLIKEFYKLAEIAKALDFTYVYFYIYCRDNKIQTFKRGALGVFAPEAARLIKHFRPAATVTISSEISNSIYL